MGEAKRDLRPEGSAILECTMASAYHYALQMAGIAAGDGYEVTIETTYLQVQAGQPAIPFARIDMGANHGRHHPR